jgi:3-oxoacyl-[acyl-carrier protein] reductase
MSEFTGRNIVITGGAGGIGMACARLFLAQAANVTLVDVSEERLRTAQQDLDGGDRVRIHVSELSNQADCKAALNASGSNIYALVHLAGIFVDDIGKSGDRDIWDRTIAANLTNGYEIASAFESCCDKSGPARLVFASSLAFRRGSFDHVAYSAAKGGIVGITRSLSRRLAPDVLVNAVAPGIILTQMPAEIIADRGARMLEDIPMKRFGEASEVASVIGFLCSSAASYMTGQTLNIDGGMING